MSTPRRATRTTTHTTGNTHKQTHKRRRILTSLTLFRFYLRSVKAQKTHLVTVMKASSLGLKYPFGSPQSRTEMVRLPVKNSRVWSPQISWKLWPISLKTRSGVTLRSSLLAVITAPPSPPPPDVKDLAVSVVCRNINWFIIQTLYITS